MYNLTTGTMLDQAEWDISVGGPFNAVKIGLFTNDMLPTRNRTLADFTHGDFGGLTNMKSVVWGVPFLNDNNQAEVLGGLVTWLTTSEVDLPVTAYGIIITNTAGTVLILAERFAQPVVFARDGQSQSLIPRLVWDT